MPSKAMVLLASLLALAACDDDGGTGPDSAGAAGVWQGTVEQDLLYVAIDAQAITFYAETDACFVEFPFEIIDQSGASYTLESHRTGETQAIRLEILGTRLRLTGPERGELMLSRSQMDPVNLVLCDGGL